MSFVSESWGDHCNRHRANRENTKAIVCPGKTTKGNKLELYRTPCFSSKYHHNKYQIGFFTPNVSTTVMGGGLGRPRAPFSQQKVGRHSLELIHQNQRTNEPIVRKRGGKF